MLLDLGWDPSSPLLWVQPDTPYAEGADWRFDGDGGAIGALAKALKASALELGWKQARSHRHGAGVEGGVDSSAKINKASINTYRQGHLNDRMCL